MTTRTSPAPHNQTLHLPDYTVSNVARAVLCVVGRYFKPAVPKYSSNLLPNAAQTHVLSGVALLCQITIYIFLLLLRQSEI